MANKISTEDLKKKIENGDNFYLIDTLSAESFAGKHIPKSLSIPYGDDFVQRVEQQVGDKNAEITVYCASSSCSTSVAAAKDLEGAGFSNVTHYAEGLAGWQIAGLEFGD